MRFILAILSGLLGAIIGWAGHAYILIVTSGPDRDGGIAMGAFFNIGPIGGIIGCVAGVWLFIAKGIIREKPLSTAGSTITGPSEPPTRARTRLSRPFAIVVLVVSGGLAWSVWYEFIRSPYLSHGADGEMTLAMQFRLPPGMILPEHSDDIDIEVQDGDGRASMTYGEKWFSARGWYRRDGDRQVLLASAELDKITYWRTVRLKLPQVSEQIWTLELNSDPYPIPNYTPWRRADGASNPIIEIRFRLTADRCSVCAFDNDATD